MDVIGLAPLQVGSLVWREEQGALSLAVVCKATYHFVPGEAVVADAQQQAVGAEDFGGFGPAPQDRQAPLLRGGERLVLHHPVDEPPRLLAALPAARPRAFAERAGAPPREVALRCDALWIDAYRSIFTLRWRGDTPIASRDERGRVLIALEQPDEPLCYEDLLALLGPAPAPSVMPSAGREDDDENGPGTVALPALGASFATARGAGFHLGGDALPFGDPRKVGVAPATPERVRSRPHASTLMAMPGTPAAAGPAWLGSPSAPLAAAPASGSWQVLDEAAPSHAIELVWANPAAAPRVRRAFGDLLANLALPVDTDPEEAQADAAAAALVRVFTVGRRCDALGLEEAMSGAVGLDARFQARPVIVAGELRLVFDETETLLATLSAALSFAPDDGDLRAVLDAVRELLATPGLGPTGAAAKALTQRVSEAFATRARDLPPGFLAAQVERILLERRAYQRRALFDGEQIRALVTLKGAVAPCPVYLPATLASALPMFSAFEARILAEVHTAQDQGEEHHAALKALALARVVAAGWRGR